MLVPPDLPLFAGFRRNGVITARGTVGSGARAVASRRPVRSEQDPLVLVEEVRENEPAVARGGPGVGEEAALRGLVVDGVARVRRPAAASLGQADDEQVPVDLDGGSERRGLRRGVALE